MRLEEVVLRNAETLARRIGAWEQDVGRWNAVHSKDNRFSSLYSDLPSVEKWWRPDALWIPAHKPHGMPLLAVSDHTTGKEWLAELTSRGVKCVFAENLDEARKTLFECVTIARIDRDRSIRTVSSPTLCRELCDWIQMPTSLGTPHSDAYAKYVNFELGRNEDVYGILGADCWHDLRELLAGIKPVGAVDKRTWAAFWKALDAGDNAQAVKIGDLGIPLEASAGEWRAVQRETQQTRGDIASLKKQWTKMPVRKMSRPLWNRELKHKRRHYHDICSLYKVAHRVWAEDGQSAAFRSTAMAMLQAAAAAGMQYERMYLTMFWAWTAPYWQDICSYVLTTKLLYADDNTWRAVGKETTAMVSKSWFFPLTNCQTIASAYFLNVEDLLGYPDSATETGAVALEVLDFVTDNYEYSYPTGTGCERDFEQYRRQFMDGVLSLLEPVYREFGARAETYDDVLEMRVAKLAGGVSGRAARERFGEDVAPAGSTKKYVGARTTKEVWKHKWGTTIVEVAVKVDERGGVRTIMATEMRDQLSEMVAMKPITNRLSAVGMDVGESPIQAMERHLRTVGMADDYDGYRFDGQVLVCWDWRAFDHFVHCAERKLMLQAMVQLTERFCRGEARRDMLHELDQLIAGTEELIFRSRAFAEDKYKEAVEQILSKEPGRATRLAGHAGQYAIAVKNPQGQQSGRFSTLLGNTVIGTTRLLVRDAELMGRTADLRHRTSIFVLNRADDVAELFSEFQLAVKAIQTMLDQGHKANPKKQLVQWRACIYLRILYAGGTMRAFPARAIYAAATASPPKGTGGDMTIAEKLGSIAKGLDMYVRRGFLSKMAGALYDDARRFFSRGRLWLPPDSRGRRPKQRFMRVQIAREVLEGATEHGGMGVLPPGQYDYDYSIKCSKRKYMEEIADGWDTQLRRHVAKLSRRAPGVDDLERNAVARFQDAAGVRVDTKTRGDFRLKWCEAVVHGGADPDTRFAERTRSLARSIKSWHRDTRDSYSRIPAVGNLINEALIRFERAKRYAKMSINGGEARFELERMRGQPGYGILDHEWFGYADLYLKELSAARRMDALYSILPATKHGTELLSNTRTWPHRALFMHLSGKLGPAGAWDKLMPPSWSGFLANTLQYCLDFCFRHYPTKFSTTYNILRLRADVTRSVVGGLFCRHSQLFIH
uniref:RNA-directed RNA polymerase n=1 Tax=Diaporthe alternavirus 1 TaxID=2973080 RepID=A0A9C7EW74_9VIRU|nr:RNA-dependent RNA polymerase 4 [Diaporthe alternavirus 1]